MIGDLPRCDENIVDMCSRNVFRCMFTERLNKNQ